MLTPTMAVAAVSSKTCVRRVWLWSVPELPIAKETVANQSWDVFPSRHRHPTVIAPAGDSRDRPR